MDQFNKSHDEIRLGKKLFPDQLLKFGSLKGKTEIILDGGKTRIFIKEGHDVKRVRAAYEKYLAGMRNGRKVSQGMGLKTDTVNNLEL